jgi:hypothetical protein
MEDKKKLIKLRSQFNKQSFVEDIYQQKLQIEDKRFGPVTFWSKKQGHELLLMKKRFVNSPKLCETEINHAKDRIKLNHDFLMRMIDYSVKVKSMRVFEVWGFYQAPLQDLRREIDKRRKNGR